MIAYSTIRAAVCRHPIPFTAVALLTVAAVSLIDVHTVTGSTLQALVGAAAAILETALFCPNILRLPAEKSAAGTGKTVGALTAVALVVMLLETLALLFGQTGGEALTTAAVVQDGSASLYTGSSLSVRVVALVAVCITTAAFEEPMFRGALQQGFARSCERLGYRRARLLGALAAALVFGVLHMDAPGVSACPPSALPVAVAQSVLKAAEAFLFGVVLADIVDRCGSIWPCVAAHAAYDLLVFAPEALGTGYIAIGGVTGDPLDLAIVAAGTALLVPLAWRAARRLAAPRAEDGPRQ